jgi:hypothetical protein
MHTTSDDAATITIGDLTVGRIGFGAKQLTGDQVWGEYPDHDDWAWKASIARCSS